MQGDKVGSVRGKGRSLDALRLSTLASLEVLDTAPEEAFDRITAMAAELFDVPIALISLIDEDRQWFKSCVGVDIRETPLEVSICRHALDSDAVMVIKDARSDPRFSGNPFVQGEPHIRFYAGAPLIIANGLRIGTLSIMGPRPCETFSERESKFLAQLAAMVVDELKLRKLQRQAEIEAQKASDASSAKSEYLANTSHEIRTPLNAIIGISHILSRSDKVPLRERELIGTLHHSADLMMKQINELLDISKIESRTIELENIPFDVDVLVQEVVSMISVRAAEKGLSFTHDTSGLNDCRKFVGDPTRIRQILTNLCSNAIKFTDKGSVQLIAVCTPASDPTKKLLNFTVKDTGIGIAPAALKEIFEPYKQADSTITRQFGGTGLGLAISKSLSDLMHGHMSVRSKPGEGSTFTFKVPLPFERRAVELEEHDEHAHKTAQKLGRVLLVEDHEPNILVAKTFVEEFGFECDVAIDGMQAVAMVQKKAYDAVLMDVQMRGMDGFEATKAIRNWELQGERSRLPVIGLTAHAFRGDRERCLAAGMDDYLGKPFRPAELERKLLHHTRSKTKPTLQSPANSGTNLSDARA